GVRVLEAEIDVPQGWLGHRPGQFAFATSDAREGAHPYTIASAWHENDRRITFIAKELGDHTGRLREKLRVGHGAGHWIRPVPRGHWHQHLPPHQRRRNGCRALEHHAGFRPARYAWAPWGRRHQISQAAEELMDHVHERCLRLTGVGGTRRGVLPTRWSSGQWMPGKSTITPMICGFSEVLLPLKVLACAVLLVYSDW
ncbi:MAG: hypothetical protein J0H24_25290, partial [Delftia acidovorans]|nr:hypothetical protein [Delftia acidovorans]